jgi:hypothetical protein
MVSSSEVNECLSQLWSTSTVWVVFTLCSVLTSCLPFLQKIARHGKCNTHTAIKERRTGSSSISLQTIADDLHEKLFIPKKLFVHLYLIGAGCAVYHLHRAVTEALLLHPPPLPLPPSPATATATAAMWVLHRMQQHRLALVLLLWTGHVLRRLLESLFLTHYGASRMHLGGYAAGLVHYILVPVCFREAAGTATYTGSTAGPGSSSMPPLIVLLLCWALPGLLFVLANFYQFQTHRILFRMKTQQRASPHPDRYHLPTESWFKVVCVPHYTAEVVIYFSLALLLPCCHSWSPELLVVWVTANLSVVAQNQWLWYQQQYPAEIPHPWYKLLPYIW